MKKITYKSCPLCESKNIHPKFKIDDYSISKESFEIYTCSNCDFTFTQHMPAEKDAFKYYESEGDYWKKRYEANLKSEGKSEEEIKELI